MKDILAAVIAPLVFLGLCWLMAGVTSKKRGRRNGPMDYKFKKIEL